MSDKRSGYVMLLSVLIIGAAGLAITLTLLVGGADNQRARVVADASAKARHAADACAEEALQQIHDNTSFSGSNSMAIGGGTCTYTVVITAPGAYTITTEGTIYNSTRRVRIYATISSSSINITSWQEV